MIKERMSFLFSGFDKDFDNLHLALQNVAERANTLVFSQSSKIELANHMYQIVEDWYSTYSEDPSRAMPQGLDLFNAVEIILKNNAEIIDELDDALAETLDDLRSLTYKHALEVERLRENQNKLVKQLEETTEALDDTREQLDYEKEQHQIGISFCNLENSRLRDEVYKVTWALADAEAKNRGNK